LYTACFFFFGFRHHDHWFRFAGNDIGCYADPCGQPAALRGTVAEMPRFYPKPPPDPGKIFETSERTLFTLRTSQLRDGNMWIPVSGNTSVSVYADCRYLRIGDEIELFGELLQPQKPDNPGGYDYADMLHGKRVLAVLRCPDKTAVNILYKNYFSLNRWIESIRRTGVSSIERHLSTKTIALAEAMIFGVRESVDEEVRQRMIDTGTMHLLAISGLHVALIAGIAAYFLRMFRFPRRMVAVSMIVFVLFYLLLTDVRTPAIRATALVCSVSVAVYLCRRTSAANVLCASALIVLFLNPPELFQFGAQLSFLATGSFLWLPKFVTLKSCFVPADPADEDLRTLRDIEQTESGSWFFLRLLSRFFRRAVEIFLVSLIVWLITMPILLSRIHVFTPVAVLVNPLLGIPLTAAMFFGFATAMLGQIPLLGNVLGCCADFSFQLLLDLIAWFQRLGGHYWVAGPPDWWSIVFYSVFSLFTFLPIKRPRRILFISLIVWIGIGIASGYYRDWTRLSNDRLTLSVFAAGHGNCVLITTPESKTIICDAGCLASPRYAADILSHAVWRQGKMRIDAILISHPDNDHFNGVSLLVDRFAIGTVLISPYFTDVKKMPERESWALLKSKLEKKKIPIKMIGDGDDLSAFGLSVSKILHPPKEEFAERENVNAASLVLWFAHRGIGVLITGDLDGLETAPFLLRKPMPAEIVMMPHHGGKSSQTEKLLNWASPKMLIYSHGKMTYKPEVLEQYRQKGYEVRSTFLEGAVEINIP
jgi:competence protein ComEC